MYAGRWTGSGVVAGAAGVAGAVGESGVEEGAESGRDLRHWLCERLAEVPGRRGSAGAQLAEQRVGDVVVGGESPGPVGGLPDDAGEQVLAVGVHRGRP